MQTEKQFLSLLNLMGGAAIERFDREFTKAVKNVQDPNTSPRTARKVTLSVTIKPNEDRNIGSLTIECKSQIAPPRPLSTAVAMGQEGGKAVAREISAMDTTKPLFGVASLEEKRKEQAQ
jgi:hypothetical protein